MQAAPARYVSVSELYSTDEVELLLDEIRDLEPTSCRGEDVQDFEIAGSGLGAWGGGGGGRSPADTSVTERSWDSHAHYSRAAPPRPARTAPLYCHLAHLLTLPAALSLLLLLCSASTCVLVWSALGRRLYLAPLAARPQLLQLAALTSALLHAALLLLHVARLHLLLPLRWDLLRLVIGAWSAATLTVGGGLTLHAVLASSLYRPAPPLARDMLISAASLGLVGGVVSASLVTYVALSLRPPPQYAAVPGGAAPGEAGGAGPSADHPDHEL